MILYHGSEMIIENPVYGKGNLRNDYGRGFYCTESEKLAKEWACSNNKNGFANKYNFDIQGLNVLYLNSEEYTLLNWLAVLTKNRTYWENGTVSQMAKKYIAEHFMVDIQVNFPLSLGFHDHFQCLSHAEFSAWPVADVVSCILGFLHCIRRAYSASACLENRDVWKVVSEVHHLLRLEIVLLAEVLEIVDLDA